MIKKHSIQTKNAFFVSSLQFSYCLLEFLLQILPKFVHLISFHQIACSKLLFHVPYLIPFQFIDITSVASYNAKYKNSNINLSMSSAQPLSARLNHAASRAFLEVPSQSTKPPSMHPTALNIDFFSFFRNFYFVLYVIFQGVLTCTV